MARLKSERELTCPCCGATLVVDLNLGRIVSHDAPPSANRPELSEADRILADQAARREALFAQSVQNEKNKGDALSQALRGGAEESEERTDYQAAARLRPRLTAAGSRQPGSAAQPPVNSGGNGLHFSRPS